MLQENALLPSGNRMLNAQPVFKRMGGGGRYQGWNFSSPLQNSFQHSVELSNPYLLDSHQTVQNLVSSTDITPSFCTRNIQKAQQKICSLLVQRSEERILILVSRLPESIVYYTVSGFTTLNQFVNMGVFNISNLCNMMHIQYNISLQQNHYTQIFNT
jgi:hypothetical protein